jgi:hypothetical protein
LLLSTGDNFRTEMMHVSVGREATVTGTICTTRRETVMPAFRDSCKGELIVTEIYTLGISDVVKESGDTTSRANNNMWDKNRFIRTPN